MRLLLLRHTDAVPGGDDKRRALSLKGREQAIALGRHFEKTDKRLPRRAYHSSLRRSRETGEIFFAELSRKPVLIQQDGLAPEDNPSHLIPWIEEQEHSLMLIGHNPFMEILAGLLLNQDPYAGPVQFRKGTLLCLKKNLLIPPQGPPFRRWQVSWALTPGICQKVTPTPVSPSNT